MSNKIRSFITRRQSRKFPLFVAVSISCLGLLSGCAGYFSESFVYEPTVENANKLSVDTAQRILANALSHCYPESSRHINALGYRSDAIAKVEFYPDHYKYISNENGQGYSVYYKDMKNLKLDYHALHEWPDYFALTWSGRVVNNFQKKEYDHMNGTCNMVYPDGPMPFGPESEVVIDAIQRLKIEFDLNYGPEAEARFKQAADQYLNMQEKPKLPDDIEVYSIQATTAIGNKNFKTAVDIYTKALQLAPWWAAGYYNRALVLAELNANDAAIIDMKHYLYLRPDAANATIVKRKIAEWGTPVY